MNSVQRCEHYHKAYYNLVYKTPYGLNNHPVNPVRILYGLTKFTPLATNDVSGRLLCALLVVFVAS